MTIESVTQAMQFPVPLWTALVAAAPLALAAMLAVWALHIAQRWSQRDSMRRVDLIADVVRLAAENEALRAECERLAKMVYPMVKIDLDRDGKQMVKVGDGQWMPLEESSEPGVVGCFRRAMSEGERLRYESCAAALGMPDAETMRERMRDFVASAADSKDKPPIPLADPTVPIPACYERESSTQRFTFYAEPPMCLGLLQQVESEFKAKSENGFFPSVLFEGQHVGYVTDVTVVYAKVNSLRIRIEVHEGNDVAELFPRGEANFTTITGVTLHKTGQPGEKPLRDGACFKFPALGKQEVKA
jgi:hypothetical protein